MDKIKKALVIGGNGFIGSNLSKRLRSEGWIVTIIDIKKFPFSEDWIGDFNIIKEFSEVCKDLIDPFWFSRFHRIYQLGAEMGGAGYIFTGDNDANVMTNSAQINISLLKELAKEEYKGRVFYSSSVCIYSKEATADIADEEDAYPANPDSNYGWEKLFSERLYQTYAKNHGINVRIARFNNTYGPFSTFKGGREKSPAAICRKVVEYERDDKEIEIWGNGKQVREFVYIDDLLDAIEIIMNSDINTPINIGPSTAITIDDMVRILTDAPIKHVDGPVGLQTRLTRNKIITSLGWSPKVPIEDGLKRLYNWIKNETN